MKIIDVSSYNPVKNFTAVKQAGYAGIICKATEGVTWNDPTFQQNFNGAKKIGLITGAYHFARPDNNQPEQEVEHYVKVVGNFDDILPPILDIEKTGNLNRQQLTDWVLRWLRKAQAMTNKVPWIYSGAYFYTHNLNPDLLKDYPVWIASYSSVKPSISHVLWQYTDKENVPGVGNCDCSITDIDLNQYVKGGVALLKLGTRGQAVATLQTNLNKLGYKLVVDGIFGPATETAVKDFQKKHGLVVDGIVGPATQATIDKALQPQPQATLTKSLMKSYTINIYSDYSIEIK